MKLALIYVFVCLTFFAQAQEKYAEGSFEKQEIDENFFKEKILTDSQRNKNVIAENMRYYNRMIKAYNERNYEDAIRWAREAFLGSIGEKIQFKVYQNKYEYANMLMQNQKLIHFVSLCESNAKIGDIQEVFDYCAEVLSEDRFAYVVKRAEQYNNGSSKKKIEIKEQVTEYDVD